MEYLFVKNLDKWQHYKDRTPPWIKLHRDILNDYEFTTLEDHQKAHLMLIWVVASQMDNKIPNDPEWLAKKIGATTDVNVTDLINKEFLGRYQDASDVLAECKQSAMRETETETETETEKKRENRKRFIPPTLKEVTDYCKDRKNGINPQGFIDHYEANGWMRGKSKIKDWKACVRTWEQNQPKEEKPFDPRDYAI